MFTMIIRNVKGDREVYRRHKAAMTLRKPAIDAGIMAFAPQADPPEPEVLRRDAWPDLDDRTMKQIRTVADCFVEEVNRESPPLENETVLSDFVTVLKSGYGGAPAGTAVLRRITDKADLYYISSYGTVDRNGSIRLKEPPLPAVEKPPLVTVGESPVATLLLELAKGLAGGLGKGIGAQLLCAIFPTGSQIDYNALLDDLARIVKEADTAQTVHEQGGKINGIVSDINSYYMERKDRAPKDELYNYLLGRHSSLYESLGIVRQAQFTKKGIATFVSGASIGFTLYQEMALEDPQATDPLLSSNIAALKKTVNDSVAYVQRTVNGIITDVVNARTSKISEPYDDPWCDVNVCKGRWYYYDQKRKKRFGPYEQCGKKDDPQARCKKARDEYCDAVRAAKNAEVTASVQWMLDSAERWKDLLQRPLG